MRAILEGCLAGTRSSVAGVSELRSKMGKEIPTIGSLLKNKSKSPLEWNNQVGFNRNDFGSYEVSTGSVGEHRF